MEDGSVLEAETKININVGVVGGNPKRGRNRKNKDQVGRTTRRKQLSDITNTVDSVRRGRFDGGGEENAKALSCSSSSDHVAHLLKENAALLKVIGDKDKVIEMNGIELQKLRVSLQKASLQNAHLAQTNSMMLAELNFSKERLRALQHEMGCTMAALKSKTVELEEEKLAKKQCLTISTKEEKLTKKQCSMMNTEEEKPTKMQCPIMSIASIVEANTKCANTTDVAPTVANKEARNTSRKCPLEGKSLTSTAMIQQAAGKEKDDWRSSDLESEQCEPTENSFVMKDVVLDSSAISSEKEQNNKNISQPLYENQEIRRTSVGRPMRKAAKKVSSYKEIPLNIKMRREDN
ncbi:Shugoshin C-terminal protein [Dioscorea alata]|uniref:Shugoshin C-terminal protein n=1 Tax=Dioscorea alata TaxID=55571 RepID=A0ACB7WTV9_DIOAL|nr:Shugoshin C-terminal protein [Dioscorea alata]